MTFPPLLDFAAQYPWTSFWLAWPTALVLISIAWTAASLISSAMSQVTSSVTSLAQLAVVVIRGYPPSAPAEPAIGPDSARDNEPFSTQ